MNQTKARQMPNLRYSFVVVTCNLGVLLESHYLLGQPRYIEMCFHLLLHEVPLHKLVIYMVIIPVYFVTK